MLTRCPACATHFRVTAEQLKARSGRVRCGACQHVFNALDSLIEEPVVVLVAPPVPEPVRETMPPFRPVPAAETTTYAEDAAAQELAVLPAPAIGPGPGPMPEAFEAVSAMPPETPETSLADAISPLEAGTLPAAESAPLKSETSGVESIVALQTETAAAEAFAPVEPETAAAEASEADVGEFEVRESDAVVAEDAAAWSETFPEPPPPPRRWPWVIGSLLAIAGLALQAVLAFRVELAVLSPQIKPALVVLCDFADCEVGLPAKVGMVGIEASDLHPDSDHPGRLALAATLKNRAPFAQQFPHLELTLTDTADQAIARKILAPTDYLSPTTSMAAGMPPNADIVLAVGVEPRDLPASGYRLYLFYP